MNETDRNNMRRMPVRPNAALCASPNLLTQEEVIHLLRLDTLNLKRPREALRNLRRTGQIAYVKVCGKILFPHSAIEEYLRDHLVNVSKVPPD